MLKAAPSDDGTRAVVLVGAWGSSPQRCRNLYAAMSKSAIRVEMRGNSA
jgi:hypothetical protein